MFSRCLFPASKGCLSTIWKTVELYKLHPTYDKLIVTPNIEIVRFKKRKGTRAAADAAKKARKIADANKPPPVPKHLQRKVKISAELERRRCVDENWLQTQPIDNVYNMKLYRGKPYSIPEAVNILRDVHIPSLLNDPSALIYITAELDLKTKKQTKFVDDFNGVITYPHEFDSGHKNNIIVICKETQDQEKAAEAGAVYAGSVTLIKQILAGTISSDDFDFIICHPDSYKELNVLRGILKRRYPTLNNGLLRIDIDKAVTTFQKGIEYKLTRSALEIDFGWVNIVCGRLNMPTEQIEENIKHVLNMIEKHKPGNTSHIVFNVRTLLWCDKSRDKLKIPHWNYLPNYPENAIFVEDDDKQESSA